MSRIELYIKLQVPEGSGLAQTPEWYAEKIENSLVELLENGELPGASAIEVLEGGE